MIANQMPQMRARVIIQRNHDLDLQALMMDRPRITRRKSTHRPDTPQLNSSAQSQPRSAPNTPKSVKSILKAAKSKPFTLVGPKRPNASKNSILNYFVPKSSKSAEVANTESPPPSPRPDVNLHQGSPEPCTSGSNQTSITLPPTPEPESSDDRQIIPFDDTTIGEHDEFFTDVLQLNESDTLYVTDEEDI